MSGFIDNGPPAEWVNPLSDEDIAKLDKEAEEEFDSLMHQTVDISTLSSAHNDETLLFIDNDEGDGMRLAKFYQKNVDYLAPIGLLYYWCSSMDKPRETFINYADSINQSLYELAMDMSGTHIEVDDVFIDSLNILPEQQKKGFGTKIIKWLIAQNPNAYHVYISISEKEKKKLSDTMRKPIICPETEATYAKLSNNNKKDIITYFYGKSLEEEYELVAAFNNLLSYEKLYSKEPLVLD